MDSFSVLKQNIFIGENSILGITDFSQFFVHSKFQIGMTRYLENQSKTKRKIVAGLPQIVEISI